MTDGKRRSGNISKNLIRVLVFILGTFLGCYLLLNFAIYLFVAVGGFCATTEIIKEEYSPNGLFKIIIYEYNCGATDDYSTNVSIYPFYVDTPLVRGNILRKTGYPDLSTVNVTWIDNKSILVDYDPDYSFWYSVDEYWHFFKVVYSPKRPNERDIIGIWVPRSYTLEWMGEVGGYVGE